MTKSSNHRSCRLLALTPLAFAIAVSSANAAQRVDVSMQDVSQLSKQYDALAATRGAAPMAHTRHEQLLRMDPESRLLLKKRSNDFGKRNHRYQQTFRGVPVFGEGVIVSENADSGQVEALFGRMVTGLASELPAGAPKVAKAQALSLAKRAALGNQGLKVER